MANFAALTLIHSSADTMKRATVTFIFISNVLFWLSVFFTAGCLLAFFSASLFFPLAFVIKLCAVAFIVNVLSLFGNVYFDEFIRVTERKIDKIADESLTSKVEEKNPRTIIGCITLGMATLALFHPSLFMIFTLFMTNEFAKNNSNLEEKITKSDTSEKSKLMPKIIYFGVILLCLFQAPIFSAILLVFRFFSEYLNNRLHKDKNEAEAKAKLDAEQAENQQNEQSSQAGQPSNVPGSVNVNGNGNRVNVNNYGNSERESSNGGFVTGMLVGNMLSGGSTHHHYHHSDTNRSSGSGRGSTQSDPMTFAYGVIFFGLIGAVVVALVKFGTVLNLVPEKLGGKDIEDMKKRVEKNAASHAESFSISL